AFDVSAVNPVSPYRMLFELGLPTVLSGASISMVLPDTDPVTTWFWVFCGSCTYCRALGALELKTSSGLPATYVTLPAASLVAHTPHSSLLKCHVASQIAPVCASWAAAVAELFTTALPAEPPRFRIVNVTFTTPV